MFTLLADSIFTATRVYRNNDVTSGPRAHGDHYVPKSRRTPDWQARTFNPYRDLW